MFCQEEKMREVGLSLTSLSISLSNTNFPGPWENLSSGQTPDLVSGLATGLHSKDGPGEGGLQTNAPWPQNFLSRKIH